MVSISNIANWENIIVAIITASSLIAVAYLQFVYKSGKKRGEEARAANEMFAAHWAQNREDHNYVVGQINALGKNLGRSIDKTNKSVERIEGKLDNHIRDHAIGEFDI